MATGEENHDGMTVPAEEWNMARAAPLTVGEPAPWFTCRMQGKDRFEFDNAAGRHVVLCFFGSATDPAAVQVLRSLAAHRDRFDDTKLAFIGVSVDPGDEQHARVKNAVPGIHFLWDFDRAVSRAYGAVRQDGTCRPLSFVLDPLLRVIGVLPIAEPAATHLQSLLQFLAQLPAPREAHPAAVQAPVLVLPSVFEPTLCRALIDDYSTHGGVDSGFMCDVDGRTVEIIDHAGKQRRDRTIEDQVLQHACLVRIRDRLVPEIHKVFQFQATRMERYLVACYDAEEGGHFRPHRDNNTRGTAHRRFAVSLFLNSGEYEGGFLRFPEFGSALYSAPPGGAAVFSCSLLHEATRVTRGRRFMFLPFLYDDAAQRVREANAAFVDSHR